jgi:hypothetical protein
MTVNAATARPSTDLRSRALIQEVWMCDPEGRLDFYSAAGELPASELMPSFPTVVA